MLTWILILVAIFVQRTFALPAESQETPPVALTPAPVLEIGQECRSTLLPPRSEGGHSEFLPICDPLARLECISGRCQCKKGFTLSHSGSKCLEIGRNGLESPCEEDVQCWKGLLGRLSECDTSRASGGGFGVGKCRCYESESVPIVFHQGRCYYGESLGDYCQIDGLCSATTANAICVPPPRPHGHGGSGAGVCQCATNYVASWDKSRCLPIAVHGLDSACEENIQCEKSGLGTLSECNQERMVCQCYHIPQMEISTIYYAGRCYLTASQLGDVCQVSPQCDTKIKHATCGADGKCRCEEGGGYLPAPNNTACILREESGANLGVSVAVSNDEMKREPLQAQAGGESGPALPPVVTLATPSTSTPKECLEDSHCTRVYGSFGRCNVTRGKCECFVEAQIPSGGNLTSAVVTEVIKCLPGKRLGEPCKHSRQCLAMNPASTCSGGLCECLEPTHVMSVDGRKCLPVAVAGFGAFCDEDAQCIKSSLGPLSICNEKSNACECTSLLPMSLYNGTCYFQRWVGSFCAEDAECRASLGSGAGCVDGKCHGDFSSAPATSTEVQDLYSRSSDGQKIATSGCMVLILTVQFWWSI